jgi:hypothetical protein
MQVEQQKATMPSSVLTRYMGLAALLSTGQMSLIGQAAMAVVATVALRRRAVRSGFIGRNGLDFYARLELKRTTRRVHR